MIYSFRAQADKFEPAQEFLSVQQLERSLFLRGKCAATCFFLSQILFWLKYFLSIFNLKPKTVQIQVLIHTQEHDDTLSNIRLKIAFKKKKKILSTCQELVV